MVELYNSICFLLKKLVPLVTFMGLCNGFFSRASIFHYRKLGLYTINTFNYSKYFILSYWYLTLDFCISKPYNRYIEPIIFYFKLTRDATAFCLVAVDIIEKLPKEQQKAMTIAVIIMVTLYIYHRLEERYNPKIEGKDNLLI